MLSLLKNLWSSFDTEKQKLELQEKFEQEQLQLEAELDKESTHSDGDLESPLYNVIGNQLEREKHTNEDIDKSDCFKRTGVVTTLKSNHGTIDYGIFFDINVALGVFTDLKVGCRVEYLAYQSSNSDHIKVVKIEQVIDLSWTEEVPTEEKIEKQIAELKNEKPKYFNTHQRNILGLITARKRDSILIDTDYKTMNVNLDDVEINFVPVEGDRVYVCCNVQSDENFVDKQGEILQEVSVYPARMLKDETCTVTKMNSDWGVLNKDAYFTFDDLPLSSKLNVDDIVNADLIECERGTYVWRCVRLSLVESVIARSPLSKAVAPSPRNEKHAVTVTDNIRCIFTSTFETQEFGVSITNNCDRKLVVKSFDFPEKRNSSALRLLQSGSGVEFPFALLKGETRVVRMIVESQSYGETRLSFIIQFNNFRVRRSVQLIVCDSEEAATAARVDPNKENMIAATTASITARHSVQRSRHYANQVWSKKSEVIPGVGMATKRRFIAQRIPYFEVPERLRDCYLTTVKRQEMLDNIEGMFPCLKEDLNFTNYARRFQTLLHLEEIEYFVNFRNYDRERAHFTRDGEFLSLTIENLAERRPSLVLGDVVRAINPWAEQSSTSDARSFDGVIHKVLFNRVLLKFNAGFQTKYNGEDYRLEFYFSRYGFRKQHFAVNRILKHLGESFLFPSKIQMRENLQLNAELDENSNLLLNNSPSPWYNKSLNEIQKKAISNILRGEAQNMPYVIFGPPGTGKTITLVETVLQLVKNVPSARLLVGAPSNSSADLITTRIIESGVLQPGDFVRLVSQNQIEKDLIPEHLMPYSATVDIAADGTCDDAMIITDSGLKLKCQMKYLGRHRATISTCSTLGNFLQMGFPPNHFTHVIIDESGQCTEPEVMVAIAQVSQTRGQVVLAGDPHQLQAIVINRFAGERGLSLSFLERILKRAPYHKDRLRFPETYGYDPRLVTKLINNYRALPSLLSVYNDLFYDSELKAEVKDKDSREANLLLKLDVLLPKSETRSKSHGVFFNGVRSENMQEKDSPSWYNPVEAKNVFLMTIQLYRQNIQPGSIGIITPYMKQVKHLRSLFITADIAMPKIGSVEEFQGQERDIILISTVRSSQKLIVSDLRHSLGFVQSSKRMNVAISRARYLMFIFGNPHLLSLDSCWRSYIQYCVDNDAYLGCDLPEHMEPIELNDDETQEDD